MSRQPQPTTTRKGYIVGRFSGRQFSFGRADDSGAINRFRAFLARWELAGRVLTSDVLGEHRTRGSSSNEVTVDQLVERYTAYIRAQKAGAKWLKIQLYKMELSLRPAQNLYGSESAESFSPKRLKIVRAKMIDSGRLCRAEINARVRAIRKAFKWAVAEELVPPSVLEGLRAVESLRLGEFAVKEGRTVGPVPWSSVEPILPHIPRPVRALVLLMWYSGGRPSELFGLRPSDIDRSGEVWTVELASHKTAGKGKRRALFFGPESQRVLRPFLLRRPADAPLFSPGEAVADLNRKKRQDRKTPLYPSHVARYEREKAQRDRRIVGEIYYHTSFRAAVKRGIRAANAERDEKELPPILKWCPYQLRHSFATRLRKERGLEVVRCLLGHSSATMTELYAEADLKKAAEAMKSVG